MITRALTMEWRRLRTVRSTWLLSGLCLLASGGLAAAIAATADEGPSQDLAATVINPGQPAPAAILLGVLGILAWGHDHRFGTIRPVLTVVPRRGVLAAARCMVMTAWITVVAVAAVASAWLAGLAATGGDLAPFLTEAPVPRMVAGSVLFGLGCGWLGLGLGALVRSMPVAVAALFALPAVVEPLGGMILHQLHPDAELWLPFYAIGQILLQTPAPAGPTAAAGALIFLGVAAGVIAVALQRFVRRDA